MDDSSSHCDILLEAASSSEQQLGIMTPFVEKFCCGAGGNAPAPEGFHEGGCDDVATVVRCAVVMGTGALAVVAAWAHWQWSRRILGRRRRSRRRRSRGRWTMEESSAEGGGVAADEGESFGRGGGVVERDWARRRRRDAMEEAVATEESAAEAEDKWIR
ncbi:uncharacterized protein A4U43_C05F14100 [Asparagus officinalis]|uniref:Uncharacterized protein n=1 Tax=Asparagus officinalis TaxID=4686 RepID=A0A5P1ERQ9_ASPOF|nr:uncharacterized protein A4U43_C05F14100 [Asparagus officinalis]